MTKQAFTNRIIFSSILTAIAIVLIVAFSVTMFGRYAPPNEKNTISTSGTVSEVYHAVPKGEVVVSLSNGEKLKLVYPMGIQNLYSTIGYDIDELADLLEGQVIQCRRMEHLPWAVEITVGDTKLDNIKLTAQQMVVTRVAIVIVGAIMLALCVGGEAVYLKAKYQAYRKIKRKQERKAKRALKLMEKSPETQAPADHSAGACHKQLLIQRL